MQQDFIATSETVKQLTQQGLVMYWQLMVQNGHSYPKEHLSTVESENA